jgi:hypothetical protein
MEHDRRMPLCGRVQIAAMQTPELSSPMAIGSYNYSRQLRKLVGAESFRRSKPRHFHRRWQSAPTTTAANSESSWEPNPFGEAGSGIFIADRNRLLQLQLTTMLMPSDSG